MTKEYKALEDEFRIALVLESNRYNDASSLYERSNRDFNQLKQDLQFAKQREERDKALITELNSVSQIEFFTYKVIFFLQTFKKKKIFKSL